MYKTALLTLAATASLVVADDFKRTDGKGSCNVGDVKVSASLWTMSYTDDL